VGEKNFDEEAGVLVFVLSRQLRRRVRNNLFARLMQITEKMATGVMSRGDNRDTLANAPMIDCIGHTTFIPQSYFAAFVRPRTKLICPQWIPSQAAGGIALQGI